MASAFPSGPAFSIFGVSALVLLCPCSFYCAVQRWDKLAKPGISLRDEVNLPSVNRKSHFQIFRPLV
jgi:hypothetical protein